MKIKESYFLLACLLIILIYLSPYLFWGQDCLIKTGDNLDSNVPWLKVMADNVHLLGWPYDVAPQVMNGIPKMCLGSQLNMLFLLYLLFPPFIAYVLNLFLLHFIAFAGMVLLLKKIVPKIHENENVILFGTALCFSLLDFWPSGGLSVAGQPLLLYALLRIKESSGKPWHFVVIILFPFYSSLVLVGVFSLIVLIVWVLVDILRLRKNHFLFYFAIFLLAVFYLIAEYNLVMSFFLKGDFISHRVEFVIPSVSFTSAIFASVKLFLYGLSSHASVFQFPLIIAVALAAAVLLTVRKQKADRILISLLMISASISVVGGFYNWTGLDGLKKQFIFFKTFDLSRFSFLLPLLFYVILFYSMLVLFDGWKKATILVTAFFIMQSGLAFKRNASDRTLYHNIRSLTFTAKAHNNEFTYRNYYSENLFRKIKEFIAAEPETYRVLCLGIDPGVLLFNGFYTLDAYVANYPLSYKQRFRRIIEKELEKNESIRRMFDDFGSTCYLYSAEIGLRTVTRNEYLRINDLDLDRVVLEEMGCNYLVSTVKLKNPARNGFKYLKRFEDPASIWRIYLYKTEYTGHV